MDFNGILGIAWENIFIGLLGAAIVSFLTFICEYIKNKKIEHKFPLSGKYITKYEDLVDGKKVVTTALAVLKQNGTKIKGKTWFGDRVWILEGTIIETGNIYGAYFSESPWDKSVGEFFLSIDANKKMCGLWSGYDSANDIINSGKYIFTPILKKVSIVNYERAYASQILRISDNELGKDYFSIQDLDFFTDNNALSFCKIAKVDNKVVGFAMSVVLSQDELIKYLKIEKKDLPKFIAASDNTCVIKTVSVDSNFQGMGIGYKLVKSLIEDCKANNIKDFASVAWKSGETTNIKGILETFDFKAYKEIGNYWTEDSIKEGFQCPSCGNPCHCSAVIYFGTF